MDQIAQLVGHGGTTVTELVYRHQIRPVSTTVTELVYRHQIRPVIQTGATVMDQLFGRHRFRCLVTQ